jgi:hypothetical protein
MATPEAHPTPSGMLRISKAGEADQVIYPVHADGWRQLGWTVQPPLTDQELDEQLDEELEGLDGDLGDPLAQQQDSLLADASAAMEPLEPPTLVEQQERQEHPDRSGADPAADDEPINFQAMTRQAIAALVAERTGITIDANQSKTALIAQAEAAIANHASGAADIGSSIDAQDTVMEVPNLLL